MGPSSQCSGSCSQFCAKLYWRAGLGVETGWSRHLRLKAGVGGSPGSHTPYFPPRDQKAWETQRLSQGSKRKAWEEFFTFTLMGFLLRDLVHFPQLHSTPTPIHISDLQAPVPFPPEPPPTPTFSSDFSDSEALTGSLGLWMTGHSLALEDMLSTVHLPVPTLPSQV